MKNIYSSYVENTDDRNNLGHTCWMYFLAMGGSNKKYLNMNLLVFIPEMEISELNRLYFLPHLIYYKMCIMGHSLDWNFFF